MKAWGSGSIVPVFLSSEVDQVEWLALFQAQDLPVCTGQKVERASEPTWTLWGREKYLAPNPFPQK
jgi:hypothetical protein